MARKNKNAGQLNRQAQALRHHRRRYNDERYRYRRSDVARHEGMVLGPRSGEARGREYGEVIDRHEYLVSA